MPQQPQPATTPPVASQQLQPVAMPVAAKRKPKTHPFMTQGSLVLLGLCVAGFAALYVMGRRTGPSAALGDQTLVHAKVDAALDSMGAKPTAAEMSQKTNAEAIIGNFYTAARQRQVDKDRLERNPFVFYQKAPEPTEIDVPKESEVKDEVPAELKAALEAVKTLKLQTVLVGKDKKNAALVSNNLVTVGQLVKGWTVTKIEPRMVELTWKDQKHVLELPR